MMADVVDFSRPNTNNPDINNMIKSETPFVSISNLSEYPPKNQPLPDTVRSPSNFPSFQGFPLNFEPSATPLTTPSIRCKVSDEDYFEKSTEELITKFIYERLRRRGIHYRPTTPESDADINSRVTFYTDSADSLPFRLSFQSRKSSTDSGKGGSLYSQSTGRRLFYHRKPDMDEINEALLRLVDEREHRLCPLFQPMLLADWMDHYDLNGMKDTFFTVSRDLHFKYGCNNNGRNGSKKVPVNWGRIVAHFWLTSHLACEAALAGHQELVTALIAWFTQFIVRYLREGIDRSGGWDSIIPYRTDSSLQKRADSASRMLYGVAATAVLGVFGFVMAKKYLT